MRDVLRERDDGRLGRRVGREVGLAAVRRHRRDRDDRARFAALDQEPDEGGDRQVRAEDVRPEDRLELVDGRLQERGPHRGRARVHERIEAAGEFRRLLDDGFGGGRIRQGHDGGGERLHAEAEVREAEVDEEQLQQSRRPSDHFDVEGGDHPQHPHGAEAHQCHGEADGHADGQRQGGDLKADDRAAEQVREVLGCQVPEGSHEVSLSSSRSVGGRGGVGRTRRLPVDSLGAGPEERVVVAVLAEDLLGTAVFLDLHEGLAHRGVEALGALLVEDVVDTGIPADELVRQGADRLDLLEQVGVLLTAVDPDRATEDGRRGVVVADDGEVGRHGKSELARGAEGADRHDVVGGEDRGDVGVGAQQLERTVVAGALGRGATVRRRDGAGSGIPHRRQEALAADTAGTSGHRQVPDRTVTESEQVLGRHAGAERRGGGLRQHLARAHAAHRPDERRHPLGRDRASRRLPDQRAPRRIGDRPRSAGAPPSRARRPPLHRVHGRRLTPLPTRPARVGPQSCRGARATA
ncbi:hypothetical protein FF38_07165 [Lucilia cuprina]|uniref:Uncharacterized protein n=1 Tax=Lucilia cuprina TaxID=7375 RepID=A0A0L0BV18_LUCCU|nr:hypothetical protein FF38_07165 [Lucilia cuprina]